MKNNTFFLLFILMLIGCSFSMNAQDLLDKLEKEYPNKKEYEIATFKGTRISLGHSVENRRKGVLEVKAMNLFWNIPNRPSQSFVADKWTARIALEYGLSNRLTFGVGGTTLEGVFDGFLKYNLVRQIKNGKGSPLSITLFQNASYRSNDGGIGLSDDFIDRTAFTSQVLIARKFTSQFSLQLSPTYIHRSSSLDEDPNNHFALGIGARYKVGGHISIVSEYYYLANPLKSIDTYDAFVLGVNWEMSDLMLQFQMTNARNMVEDAFITQTPNNFNLSDGNFVFGFNATYVLHFNQKKL
ncbi:hypothetical protein D1818_02530 [Aquimarina sp. BL5]|uniref:DUF5777 family beta-barrel protein n=1 Tax=Aquimarina sp. BL5 TaxID=1714860 RepID=UPI000E525ED8|nr:DUF5777 family beta-barrel protein [Aquimarina sp. BL5]AXT49747.1 hypothetical protein D1818_02530 [Aquimarina sp. BL5]RKM87651.1 hypothetical protein D7036_25000 [Aquimarina sp. BL5]